MMLQGWGGKIRVFPAMPDAWKDAVFHNLRAEGAFLISARRQNGKTVFIRIKSLAGEPCILMSDLQGPLEMVSGRPIDYTIMEDGEMEINLLKGEEVILYSAGTDPDFSIEPLPAQPGRTNCYGLNY